jgi:hypothetical protein
MIQNMTFDNFGPLKVGLFSRCINSYEYFGIPCKKDDLQNQKECDAQKEIEDKLNKWVELIKQEKGF